MSFTRTLTESAYFPTRDIDLLSGRVAALEAGHLSEVFNFTQSHAASASWFLPTPVTTYKSSGFDDYLAEEAYSGNLQLWYASAVSMSGSLFVAQQPCVASVCYGMTDESGTNQPTQIGLVKFDDAVTPSRLEGFGTRDAVGENTAVAATFTLETGNALALEYYTDGAVVTTSNVTIHVQALAAEA